MTALLAYTEFRGVLAAAHRLAEIQALPRVEWKGRELRTLRCHGETGKGPHDVHVPVALLWALIGLDRWRCPYHA